MPDERNITVRTLDDPDGSLELEMRQVRERLDRDGIPADLDRELDDACDSLTEDD